MLFLIRKVVIIIIATLIFYCWCSTCFSSNTYLNCIITSQWCFSGFGSTRIYTVAAGPITNSLCFLYFINSPLQAAVIREVKADYSISRTFAISFWPTLKNLWVDINEQHAYLASVTNPLNVCKLRTKGEEIDEWKTL